MRIAFVTMKPPFPPRDGFWLIIHNIASKLRKKHECILLTLCRSERDKKNISQLLKESTFSEVVPINYRPRRLLGGSRELLSCETSLYGRFRYPGLLEASKHALLRHGFDVRNDVVHLHGIVAGLIWADAIGWRRVCVMADSMSLHRTRAVIRWSLWRKLINNYLQQRSVRFERFILERYAAVCTVSPVDAAWLFQVCGENKPVVIPNGVDETYYSYQQCNVSAGNEEVLFFGTMSWAPNADGARYVKNMIMPMLRQVVPNVRFVVAGANPPRDIRCWQEQNWVKVTGYVQDLRPMIASAAVVLVPMVSGSGIKNKVLEAMAMGKAIVTNEMGAEAFDSEARAAMLVGRSAAEMAEETIRLLKDRDRAKQLGQAARDVVVRKYTWAAVAEKYLKVYDSTIG